MQNHEIEPREQPLVETNRQSIFRWNPRPLTPPAVESDLSELNALERSAEVFRYSTYRFEYWVSPTGILREWLRLNLLVGAIIAITGILVAPLVTLLLGEIADWIALILRISAGLVSIGLAAICGFVLLRFIKAMRDDIRPDGQNRR